MKDDWNSLVLSCRKEGDERTKRKIAKKMKSLNMFTVEFIAMVTELNVDTVKRLKTE